MDDVLFFKSMSIDHNCDVAPSRIMSQAASLRSILRTQFFLWKIVTIYIHPNTSASAGEET